jgi:TolB-like protein/DNA-binding winged helix-turn-helix (wHTH) protein/Flp pilus assembly protein TadD
LDPESRDSTIRFGDGFELDPRAWELRRTGRVLRLERIPMEILLFLAQQPGQLVSREQIVEKIWGKRVFTDTDNSINGAMRKIRHALDDDSENPRYIQTVTGLGYRFIAQPPAATRAPGAGASVPRRRSTDLPSQPETVQAPSGAQSATTQSSAPQTPGGGPAGGTEALTAGPRARVPVIPWVVALLVIGAVIALIWWHRSRTQVVASPAAAAPAPLSMVAVLPLQNLTGDASQDYFSDGLTEELIAQLGNVDPQHLSVIARTSVMRYKNTRTPVDEIGHALGAQYVLEGSVRRDAGNVRITAQLVRTSDQAHVWARDYDRQLTSVLALQGEIAIAIADEIRSLLGEHPDAVAAQKTGAAPEHYAAYDLYLRGRYFWNQRSVEGFNRALALFQEGIAKDPTYAPAYAGLADTYSMMSNYGYAVHTEAMPRAKAAAVRAIELDPNLAAAHNALADIAEDYDYDWHTAEKEFQRAIELNPNYATAHQWYADCLAFQGRFTAALAESERARELDPLSPIVAADHAVILTYARQYDRSIQAFLAVLAMDPKLARGRIIVQTYVEAGRSAEALSYLNSWRAVEPGPWTWAVEAFIRGRMGQRPAAEAALHKMEESLRSQKMDPSWDLRPMWALAYAGVGDADKLLETLEASFAERSNLATTLKVDPMLDFVRDDPRFIDLMRRAGLQ